MKFLKYEFTEANWNKLKSKIQISYDNDGEVSYAYNDSIISVVEIGFCLKEDGTQSSMYSVDILWQEDELTDFAKYKVWINPVGIHSFGASIDALYEEAYNNK